MRRSTSRWFLAATLALTSGSLAGAQDKKSDLLDDVQRRQAVAAQAFEREVDSALKEAEKLKSAPAKAAQAIEALRALLAKLDDDKTLKSERRAALLQTVKERIATLETAAKSPKEPKASEPAKKETEGKPDELLRRDLETIKTLQLEGKIHEANRLAEAVVRRHPENPAAMQARERTRIADSIREADKVRSDKASGVTGVVRSNERSATPPAGDYVLPKDWAQKSAMRKARYGNSLVNMSEREKAIVEVLNGVTTDPIQYKDLPFEEILKLLEKELRLPLVVNKQALDEMKVGYDTTLTVSLPKQVSRRTLLRRVLGELGMTYVIKNENIEITSVLRAQNELVTRFFDISDLVRFGALTGFGGQPGQDPAQGLIDFIIATVDPGSWQKNGGAGSITYFAPTKTLIVRNTAEVVNSMGGGRAK